MLNSKYYRPSTGNIFFNGFAGAFLSSLSYITIYFYSKNVLGFSNNTTDLLSGCAFLYDYYYFLTISIINLIKSRLIAYANSSFCSLINLEY